ncbi:MAG: 4Fe-4S binding protein [Candidatus Binataceae bacterium]
MTDEIYRRVAKVLDTLPNGFPATPDGLEIKLLKKVFTPDEAELFCDLKLSLETAGQVAERTGRSPDGLEAKLTSMARRGELLGIDFGSIKLFAMQPWAVGIWEFQVGRMDREFCELTEQYMAHFARNLFGAQPHVMRTLPIQTEIPVTHQALPYQQVSAIVENGKGFRLNECICKKERGILAEPCKKPHEVCLAISPVEGAGFILDWGREISKEQAYQLLREAEEAGLVHLTSNLESGHTFICNCCGCCCNVLRAMNELNAPAVVNSDFCAEIEGDECDWCGICLEERCQVRAIEEGDTTYQVIKERCIGCGLCVTACPRDAIKLVAKPQEEIIRPPTDMNAWNDARARQRSVDYAAYK